MLIADRIVERFGDDQCAPIDAPQQEWQQEWCPTAPRHQWSTASGGRPPEPMFNDFDQVDCCGEFTFHGCRR